MNGQNWARRTLAAGVSALALMGGTAAMALDAKDKIIVESAADLPRVEITLEAKPSELLDGGPALDALVAALKTHYETLDRDYDIRDATTKKGVYSGLRAVAAYEDRHADVLALGQQRAALEDKPAAKATSGLVGDAIAEAALKVGADKGATFEATFEEIYRAKVAALDWAVVQDTLQASKGQMETLNPALIRGAFEGQLDPIAANLGGKLDADTATAILANHAVIADIVPVKDEILTVLSERIAAEKEEKVDLWSPRTVALAEGQGSITRIGVWDTGVDPSLFKGKMVDVGDGVHGVAFGRDFEREDTALLPVPSDVEKMLPQLTTLVKGSLDNQANVDTPEAAQFRQTMASMQQDQVMQFVEQMGLMGNYIHGTAVAYTAIEDNPQARIFNVRYSWPYEPIPPAIDEAWAEGLVRAAKETVKSFQENDVRVVNMSWRLTAPMVEGLLLANGIEEDPDKRAERARAIFDIMKTGLEEAFASAPDVLFIAAAGNEDEDVEFVQSVPAGLNAPNIITIGAVDEALEAAGFTSYGKSIDLYANGFEVPTKAPGGMAMNLSGTSLAAPQVANLAGKLLTLNPDLTTAQLRSLIEDTATEETDRGLKVIDPKAAVAQLNAI